MKNLVALRKNRKLTQAELAQELGITTRMIQRYEKGESDIPMKNLEKLSKFFEVPVSYFYEDKSDDFTNPNSSNDDKFPKTFNSYFEVAEFFVKNQPEFLKFEIVDKMIRVYEERAIINAGRAERKESLGNKN